MMEIKCKIVTWNEIYDSTKKLARMVEDSNYNPEFLIGLARSGFVPSRLLSDFLGITALYCLKVEHWLDTTAQHKDEATIPIRVPFNVKGKRVLVVDDIVDTGKSMDISVEYVKSLKPLNVKTAVIHYITSSQHIPSFYVQKIESWWWFIYPWNLTEDLANLTMKLFKSAQNLTLEQIRLGLKEKFGLDISLDQLNEITDVLQRRKKLIKEKSQFKPL